MSKISKAKPSRTERRIPPAGSVAPAWWLTGSVLTTFGFLFIALALGNYLHTSATWDEPVHVTDGYASLAAHDYRVDPEHPPFLRMWAALPLWTSGRITFDRSAIDASAPTAWAIDGLFGYAHRFMYRDNNADQLLYQARFMIVLLGVLLGVLVFCWTFEWFGFRAAVAALALFLLEPNLAAHSTLVTTDLGVTCFIFGTVYFMWRTAYHLTGWNLAGVAGFATLAVVSKFSAAALAPILLVLLLLSVWPLRLLRLRTATLVLVTVAACALIGIWGIYGFRYLPSANPSWAYALHAEPFVQAQVPTLAHVIGWIDAHHLVPNVYAEGFLLGQAKAQVRAAFLNGAYSNTGWWYYFPLAFLMKTPIALLIAAAAGLVVWIAGWWRRRIGREVFVVVPIAVYMGLAMTTHLDIGLRHILPIYPFVIVAAAAGLQRSASARGFQPFVASILLMGFIEFASIYPHPLAFFNVLVGGASHGAEHLVDSNLDWGQDLKPLKQWMNQHGVQHINLAYFGSADPAYYGIDCTYLPGAPPFVDSEQVQAPELPGYVAVSATILSGVYFTEEQRAFYEPLREQLPVASIGHSINVYWVDRRWW